MVDEEQFSEEVDAEIPLLLKMFREEPNAMQRLSVILKQNPERIEHLVSEPIDDDTVDKLSILLPHLGAPIMGILLDLYFATPPQTSRNALILLQKLISHSRSECSGVAAPLGVGLGDMPGFDAYLLLDQLIHPSQQQKQVAKLMIELLQAIDDAPTGQLLSEFMLSLDASSHHLISERFWKIDEIKEVYRRSNWNVQTLRNRGTVFLTELTDVLRNEPGRAGLALRGIDMQMLGAWDFRQPGGKPTVPGARFICETLDPELVELVQLDTDAIEAAAAEAVRFLASDDMVLRNTALRVLERLRGREHIEAIRACLEHPVTATRITAIQALAGLADRESAAAIMSIAGSGELNERVAAIAALGRLGIGEAQQLLIDMLDDEESTVVKAALIALGELDRELAGVHLKRFLNSPDKSLRSAASKALYGRDRNERTAAPGMTQKRPHFSGASFEDPNARRAHHISADAAIRILPEMRDYTEREITERISLVCGDWAATRRKLIEHRLITRPEGIYQFTELGAAAWRVEHFIMEHYLRC